MSRLLVVVGAAAVLTSCGGTAAAPPLPRKEYLVRLSSVCRTYARQLERIPAPASPTAYGDLIDSLGRVVPLLRAQERAMRAVPVPSALVRRLRRLFALNRRSIAALRQALVAARRRDAGGVATGLVRFSSVRDHVHRLALAIGIQCTTN
jgi:hypothetical protein